MEPTGTAHDVEDIDPATFDMGDVDEVVRFAVVDHGHARVLSVVGEIDTLTAPILRTRVEEHLGEVGLLVLDLSEVTFLGSAGLAISTLNAHYTFSKLLLLRELELQKGHGDTETRRG